MMTAPRSPHKAIGSAWGDCRPPHRVQLASARLLVVALTALGAFHAGSPASHAQYLPCPWWNDQNVADTTATDWMAQLPDDLLISELSIPGTHESHSFFGEAISGYWCSICQRTGLREQLQAGIRAFDLRLRHVDNYLKLYHGITDEKANFDVGCDADLCNCGGILVACTQFLAAHPGETILMRIMPNCGSNIGGSFYCDGDSLTFSEAVEADLAKYPNYVYPWPVSDCGAMPTLGEVRGQIVILQDFVGDYHISHVPYSNPQSTKGRVSYAGEIDATAGTDVMTLIPDEAVLFSNNGDATLTRGTPIPTSNLWRSVCGGDFDSNGYDDLALANFFENRVYVYFFGPGGVMSSTSYGVGTHPVPSATADFDDDGDLDIVVGAWGTNKVNVLQNNGDGTFAVFELWVGDRPYCLTVADLNGDPWPDLVTIHSWIEGTATGNDWVKAWLGPLLQMTPYYGQDVGWMTDPEQAIAEDFDGDGDDDVVVSWRGGFLRPYENTGVSLAMMPRIDTGGDPRALAAADVDNDLDQDVIVADLQGLISVYLNDGTFAFPSSYPIPVKSRHPVGLSAADFDNDSDVDLAVTEWGPVGGGFGLDRLYILRNRGWGLWCPGKALGPYWNYLCVQDFYQIRGWGWDGGVATKIGVTRQQIDWARESATTHPESLFVNFLSGLDWRSGEVECRIEPKEVAYATNLHAYSYLTDALNAGEVWRCGIIMADFPGDGLIDAVIGHNQYGRFDYVDLGLQGVARGSVEWGDYDSDGDLDLVLTGDSGTEGVATVYRNDSGSFVDINAGLPGVKNSDAAWGDYDSDGDLDILLTGEGDGIWYGGVYRNDGGDMFNDIDAALLEVTDGDGEWGDYDNDGDLDIALTGYAPYWGHGISRVFRNDAGSFVDIDAGLPDVFASSVAWGDYDSDGDLDILLTGEGDGIWYGGVYRNDGGDKFNDIGAALLGVTNGDGEWGDYDNDGDLDIALMGDAPYWGHPISRVFRNDEGSFADIDAAMKGVANGSVTWGDHDSDGDLDILLTGASWASFTDSMYVSRIYRNDGNSFSREFCWLVPVAHSAAVWGDYDNDRDLDILLAGDLGDGNGYRAVVYRNTKGRVVDATPDPATKSVHGTGGGAETAGLEGLAPVPMEISFHCVGANPFRDQAVFSLKLPAPTKVEVEVYDVAGRRITTMFRGEHGAGSHVLTWDGRRGDGTPAAAGVYLVRLRGGNHIHTQKVVLLR